MELLRFASFALALVMCMVVTHAAQAGSLPSGSPRASIAVSAFVVEHCIVSNDTKHEAPDVTCAHGTPYTVKANNSSLAVAMLGQQEVAGSAVVVVIY